MRTCRNCGGPINPYSRKDLKYCSKECKNDFFNKKMKLAKHMKEKEKIRSLFLNRLALGELSPMVALDLALDDYYKEK